MISSSRQPRIQKDPICLLLSYLICSQIWLNHVMGYCQLSYITKLEKKKPCCQGTYYKQALQTLYLPIVVDAVTTRVVLQNNFTLPLQDMMFWVHVIHVLGMLRGWGWMVVYVMCYMAYYETIDSPRVNRQCTIHQMPLIHQQLMMKTCQASIKQSTQKPQEKVLLWRPF